MSAKSLLKTGVMAAFASLVVGLLHLVSPASLRHVMTVIASAVWGS